MQNDVPFPSAALEPIVIGECFWFSERLGTLLDVLVVSESPKEQKTLGFQAPLKVTKGSSLKGSRGTQRRL